MLTFFKEIVTNPEKFKTWPNLLEKESSKTFRNEQNVTQIKLGLYLNVSYPEDS